MTISVPPPLSQLPWQNRRWLHHHYASMYICYTKTDILHLNNINMLFHHHHFCIIYCVSTNKCIHTCMLPPSQRHPSKISTIYSASDSSSEGSTTYFPPMIKTTPDTKQTYDISITPYYLNHCKLSQTYFLGKYPAVWVTLKSDTPPHQLCITHPMVFPTMTNLMSLLAISPVTWTIQPMLLMELRV